MRRRNGISVLWLVLLVPAAVAVAVGVWAGLTWLAVLAWNKAVPAMFHGPRVDFWTMAAALFLLSLVLGSGRRWLVVRSRSL